MILPKRIWKDIPNYENYEVSSDGKVRNKKTKRVRKLQDDKNGYKIVSLRNPPRKSPRKFLVHRLVALAFIPNPNNFPEVNHIDENKANNCIWNLEWCTRKYNVNYGTCVARQVAKRKESVKCIETNIVYDCIKSASESTGVNKGNISSCCRGTLKTAGGYHWEYYKEEE